MGTPTCCVKASTAAWVSERASALERCDLRGGVGATHPLDAVDERGQQARRLGRDLEIGEPPEDLVEHHRDFTAGEIRAEAEVRSAGPVTNLILRVGAPNVE